MCSVFDYKRQELILDFGFRNMYKRIASYDDSHVHLGRLPRLELSSCVGYLVLIAVDFPCRIEYLVLHIGFLMTYSLLLHLSG